MNVIESFLEQAAKTEKLYKQKATKLQTCGFLRINNEIMLCKVLKLTSPPLTPETTFAFFRIAKRIHFLNIRNSFL